MKIYLFIIIIFILLVLIYKRKSKILENFSSTKPKYSNVTFIDSSKRTKIDVVYNKCKHLYTKKSPFQQIDVYNHPVIGNMLAIDNDLQLTSSDEKNYHEMIVHVPMNYIADAKNVLIIGGGDGGTLTEVLKHNNLQNIYNIEIDKEVIIACKKYFPQIGKSFDDSRVNVINEDAAEWINNKVTNKLLLRFFDVVILDSTDFGVSDSLFTDTFYYQLKKIMKKKSVFTLNYESLGWFGGNLKNFKKDMKKFFKHIYIYQVFQPTFHSGHYSFAIMSDLIHPTRSVIDWNAFRSKKINTYYYTPKIHYGSFALPNKIIHNTLRKKKKRLGLLVTFDIQGVLFSKLNDINNVDIFFNKILDKLNLTEIKRIKYEFNPQGLTMISLLKESHLSIHTWPEKGSACIDIFNCGKFKYNKNNLIIIKKIINKYFSPKAIYVNQIDRNIDKKYNK